MKYVAVIEISDDEVELLESKTPVETISLTPTAPINLRRAPEPMKIILQPIDGYKDSVATKHIKEGYNQALRDCGVLEE